MRLTVALVAMLLLGGFSSSQFSSQALGAEQRILKIWNYQEDTAMGVSWRSVRKDFEAKYPNVKIEFEEKGFEQMQKIALMVLNSPDVPDVMLTNKGNATAGLYSKEGLLTDLTQVAKERGWDKIMSPSIQMTCRYDKNGIMGSGKLYGVTNYGEFVFVYYNKDMFKKYGVNVPTNLKEFEAVCDKFVAAGITPMPIGGSDGWPLGHDWWEMVLYNVDRNLITNYYLLQGDVDFHGAAFTFGAEKFLQYFQRGYFGKNANAVSYDDANATFIQGKHPMYITGTWIFGTFMDKIKDFDWGLFTMPGKKFAQGSGGDIWVVPQKAKNKDLAYDYISMTLAEKAQTLLANAGGVPLNADPSKVENKKVRELIQAFNTIIANDGLAYYPDWPVPGYIDTLGSGLQQLVGGKMSAAQFNDYIAGPYKEYKKSITR